MADIDENNVVPLGGKDGWINSTTFADQVAPFIGGDLIRVPLRHSSMTAAFRQRIDLLPVRQDPPGGGVEQALRESHLPK